MLKNLEGVKNYKISVKEKGEDIVFEENNAGGQIGLWNTGGKACRAS